MKNRFEIGEAFETTVVAVTDTTVFVDLNAKSEGLVDTAEFSDENGKTSIIEEQTGILLEKEDIENATIYSYNVGLGNLASLGFDNEGRYDKSELDYFREISNPNKLIIYL